MSIDELNEIAKPFSGFQEPEQMPRGDSTGEDENSTFELVEDDSGSDEAESDSEIAKLRKQIKKFQEELDKKKEEIKNLEKEKVRLENQLKQANHTIEEQKKEIDSLKNKLDAAYIKINNLNIEIRHLERRIKELNDENHIILKRLRFSIALCITFGLATIAFGILYANSHTRYAQRLANKDGEIVMLKDSLQVIIDLQPASNANNEEIQKLKAKNTAQQNKIDSLFKVVNGPSAPYPDVIDLREQLEEAIKQINTKKREINDLNTRLNKTEIDMKTLNSQIKGLEEENSKLKNDLKECLSPK